MERQGRLRRWQWGGAAAVAALAGYAALGFWGLPALVRWQLPQQVQALVQRPASVQDVRFDPFRLRLQVDGLALTETDGTPLLAVRQLVADLSWSSLWRRGWRVDQLRLDGPQVRLAIAPDGRFNLAELAASLPRSQPDNRPASGPPAVVIEDLALQDGRIDWDDRQAGVRDRLDALDLRFERFSTLPDEADAWQASATLAGGGRLRWRGEAGFQPLAGKGELVLEGLPLAPLSPYLKPHVAARLQGGMLGLVVPYRFAHRDGHLAFNLDGASASLQDLAVQPAAGGAAVLRLKSLQALGLDVDLLTRRAALGTLRLQGLQAAARRLPDGRIDLQALLVARPVPPKAATPAPAAASETPWSLALGRLELAEAGLQFEDALAQPPVQWRLDGLSAQASARTAPPGEGAALRVSDGRLAVSRFSVGAAGRSPLTLEQLRVDEVQADLGAHTARIGRVAVGGGQLAVRRAADGTLDVLSLLPPSAPATPAAASQATPAASPAWQAVLGELAIGPLALDITDAGTGISTRVQDLRLRAQGLGTDLSKPVMLDAGFGLREGGTFKASGELRLAAATAALQLQLKQLPLVLAQPLLSRQVRLKLAGGTASTEGRLQARWDSAQPQVRYDGRFDISGLRLNEMDGDLFASWKSLSAERFSAGTAGVDIPELRLDGAVASLIIEPDRSFNAARLLVRDEAAAGGAATPAAKASSAPAPAAKAMPAGQASAPAPALPVRIQRFRLQDAQLDFLDQSLRPQFGARIQGLSGVVTGLATSAGTRTQLELDGRVEPAGLARIRGALDPQALRDSTDISVVFRNVDMVQATPYAMKFAGYRIADGRISLDLRYRVRQGKLDGDNRIVIDRLTLGEQVDSPDAIKLPLSLALALLKDSDGRIDLGLPVTGDLDDPQFSYGAIIWKAVVNVITKVVTAPFRALGGLLGGNADTFEAVEFDPGSARLLPPEKEKLQQMAKALAAKPQLALQVPGSWDPQADAQALRQFAARSEVVRRAGLKLEAGESPGPLDVGGPAIRAALRALYVQRFGNEGWEQAKRKAEQAPAAAGASQPARAEVPVWRRVGNLVQGEPQVADAVGFYRGLAREIERAQPLADDALARLGGARAQAVAAALREAGVDAARVQQAAPAALEGAAEGARVVPLKLGLAAK